MQVKIGRGIVIIALAVCLCMNVFASGSIDMERNGNITVQMKFEDEAVSGGTLTLYHVAVPVWSLEQYTFEFTQPFEDCTLSLNGLDRKELAIAYSEYVLDNAVPGVTRRINMNGYAEFKNLELGLYLVVQQEAAAGYFPIEPFLISVPMNGEDGWIYDVDATPKVDIEREPQPEKPPIKPDIPDTGQLKWPIPVLAASGVVFFGIGWVLCLGGKKKKDEA